MSMKKEDSGRFGVFWVVDGELLAIPFDENIEVGIAKSGRNYNHKLLWESVRPPKCKKKFDYYPRGRVEINAKETAVIYLNPNIDEEMLAQIREFFGLPEGVRVHYDGSEHYYCYLDRKL